MIASLPSPAGERVCTNKQVERVNRRLRYFEKVRYKGRRRRTSVRFIVLAIDRWYRQEGQHRAKPKIRCKIRQKRTTSPETSRPKDAV